MRRVTRDEAKAKVLAAVAGENYFSLHSLTINQYARMQMADDLELCYSVGVDDLIRICAYWAFAREADGDYGKSKRDDFIKSYVPETLSGYVADDVSVEP